MCRYMQLAVKAQQVSADRPRLTQSGSARTLEGSVLSNPGTLLRNKLRMNHAQMREYF